MSALPPKYTPPPPLPFSRSTQLHHDFSPETSTFLPGNPRVSLSDKPRLTRFLLRDLFPTDLERMAPHLWWMSKADGANISPLHRQRVKRRDIVPSEDPKLHLVWHHDRIFIKPLPAYLTSHAFLEGIASGDLVLAAERDALLRAALGLLRSYFYLIQHESDFRIAQDPAAPLIAQDVSWPEFCAFSARFADEIPDDAVLMRYRYGEIRLTRLNFYAWFLLRRHNYQRINGQYSAYFGQFYAPLLFVFGLLSIILSAMQAELGVEQVDNGTDGGEWARFRSAARGFSVTVLFVAVILSLWLALAFVYKIAKEWYFALGHRPAETDYQSEKRKAVAV